MLTQNREYEFLFAYLRSLNFHYLDTWVIECANYYKSIKPNISLEDLKSAVKQQWLLANLREIKVPSLPASLATKEKIILEGKYAVQVEEMIDSSISCYSQFKKMRKISNEDIEETEDKNSWEVKAKRCLTFKLCDGVQEVQAMEYQPIKKIKNNDPELLPGFKMVIIGPVECRKGMILLKDENVIICGGEVDILTVSNSLKSLIMLKLEIQEEDYPEEFENDNFSLHESHLTPSTQFCDNQSVATLLSENDDILLSLPLEHENLEPHNKIRSSKSNLSMEEEIKFNDLSTPNFVEETDLFDTFNRNPPPNLKAVDKSNETKLLSVSNINTKSNLALQSDLSNELINVDNDFVEDNSLGSIRKKSKNHVQTKLPLFFKNDVASVSQCSISTSSEPVTVSCEPFVYLKNIMSVKLKKPLVFTVKAIILTLTKKITINKDEYNLTANITDGSMATDVEFSSLVIENLLDYSPSEMINMMKVKNSNSAIGSRIKESFSKAQEKLISLNCLMKIKFFNNDRIPLVLFLEELNRYHLNALQERQVPNE